MNKLRLAVLGAGRLGGFHAQKLAQNESVELVAVVDPVAAARDRVAATCKCSAAADYRDVIGSIDAAVIATPTSHHYQVAMDLLVRGIHLLVEKPLCPTLAQADELARAARRRQLVLQVGHVERFSPAFDFAAPRVGRPKYIEAVRASGYTFRSMDIGVVLDLMIHDIDLVLAMVRSPLRKIEAMGLSVLGGHEDAAQARIEFRCGCVAHLSASRVSHAAGRTMQVWGTGGFASMDFATRKTTVITPSETLVRRELDIDALAAEAPDRREYMLQEHLRREDREFAAVDALSLEQADFLDAIRHSRPPRVTGEHGRDAVAVAEQILGKIRTHAWDDQPEGPVGPLAAPRVVPAPLFGLPEVQFPYPTPEIG